MANYDSRSGLSPRPPEVIKPVSFDVDFGTFGKEETKNEDNHFFNSKNMSFGIFDGMGGQANGQISSQFCSNLIQTELGGLPTNISPEKATVKLKEILLTVNQSFLENKTKFNLGGSTGTFGVICCDSSDKRTAVIASVGDSRAYLYRPGNRESLIQLTTDDGRLEYSFKNSNDQKQFKQIKEELDNASNENNLSEKGKLFFDMRNQIGNYFGHKNENDYQPNIVSVMLQKGDIILLTTDGVHDNLTTNEITFCLSKHKDSSNIIEDLIKSSYNRSQNKNHKRAKSDDMTAVCIICK